MFFRRKLLTCIYLTLLPVAVSTLERTKNCFACNSKPDLYLTLNLFLVHFISDSSFDCFLLHFIATTGRRKSQSRQIVWRDSGLLSIPKLGKYLMSTRRAREIFFFFSFFLIMSREIILTTNMKQERNKRRSLGVIRFTRRKSALGLAELLNFTGKHRRRHINSQPRAHKST
jgi:hypothetical protein